MTQVGSGSGSAADPGTGSVGVFDVDGLRRAAEGSPPELAAAGLRLPALAFSVPYLFAWSAALALPLRLAATGAHACLVLAVGAWLTAADHEDGLHHRLGVRAPLGESPVALARAAALPLAAAALLLALPLLVVEPFLPALAGGALAGGWALTHGTTPPQRYDGLPEVGLPLWLLAVPGVALKVLAPPGPSWWSILAGSGFLLALVLALGARDADRDAAAGLMTVPRRFGVQAARMGWFAGLVAVAGALAGIYYPISPLEWVAIIGALGFVVGMALPRRRVLVMAFAHGVFGCAVLLGLP